MGLSLTKYYVGREDLFVLNKVILMGRLTRDPELRSTTGGVDVTNFTLAVDRSYTKAGAEKETDFLDCVAWRGTAGFISRYFKKGMQVAVTGRVQTRKWKDQQEQNRVAVEVVVDEAFFADSAPEQPGSSVATRGHGKTGAGDPPGIFREQGAAERQPGVGRRDCDSKRETSAVDKAEPRGWQSQDVSFTDLGDEELPFI